MNQPARRIDFIDDVRGIAILSVFLFHAVAAAYGYSMLSWNGWLRDFAAAPKSFLVLLPLNIGWIGVPIFFVVSGFCIHVSFNQQGRDWGSFFIRRFFRIYPAYIAALVLFALLRKDPSRDFWLQFVNHVLLIHNFNGQTYSGINYSFWTIAIEAQLYLLYPLLLALVAKFGWKGALIIVGTCECLIHGWDAVVQTMLGAQMACGYKIPPFFFHASPFLHYVNVSPLAYWFSWSIGALTADAFLKGRPLPFAKFSLPLCVLLVLMAYFVRPLSSFFFLFSAVTTAVAISKYLAGSRLAIRVPRFLPEQLRRAGVYSYSIYLLHQPMLTWFAMGLAYFIPAVPELVKFFCCAGFWLVIMPLAGIWYRFIEVPGVALGKRLIQKMTSAENISGSQKAFQESHR